MGLHYLVSREAQWLLRKYSVHEPVEIPLQLTRLNMLTPIANQRFGRRFPESVASPLLWYQIFDHWIAKLIMRQRIDALTP
jgi:hypothetical protein